MHWIRYEDVTKDYEVVPVDDNENVDEGEDSV